MPVRGGFEEAMKLTLVHEGGWYDGSDPRDPNPTMYGVIQSRYDAYRAAKGAPKQSVRLITMEELLDVYREYWVGVCDQLPPLLGLCVFDMSINAGPATARKLVQRALDIADDGDFNDSVDDDGKFGPKTLATIQTLKDQDWKLAMLVCMERIRYYDSLADDQRLRPNLKSWVHRTIKFYDQYLALR